MRMIPTITAKSAQRIVDANNARVPIEYDNAVKALQACIDIDDAKYWSEKADALAAWAKIYRSKDAELKAKRLKLHAYRRMGELSDQLAPKTATGRSGGAGMLREKHGFSYHQAKTIRTMALLPKKKFEKAVNSDRPPAPHRLERVTQASNLEWDNTYKTLAQAVRGLDRYDPVTLARSIREDSVPIARNLVFKLTDWLDAFEQALPSSFKK